MKASILGASIDPQNVAGSAWDPLDLLAFRSSIWRTSVAAGCGCEIPRKKRLVQRCIDELWWVMVSYGELWWVMMSYGELWWVMVSYGELWWVMVSYGELWWVMVSYGELMSRNSKKFLSNDISTAFWHQGIPIFSSSRHGRSAYRQQWKIFIGIKSVGRPVVTRRWLQLSAQLQDIPTTSVFAWYRQLLAFPKLMEFQTCDRFQLTCTTKSARRFN